MSRSVERWTTRADVVAELQRLWRQGKFLRHRLGEIGGGDSADLMFPLRIRLKKPTTTELVERFDEARRWIAEIDGLAGTRVEWKQLRHRTLGANRVPDRLWVDSFKDALSLLGPDARADIAAFDRVVTATKVSRPELLTWVNAQPLKAVGYEAVWPALLAVVAWVERHPRSGLYLRLIDLPSIDTKFVEAHRAVLAELIDHSVPEAVVDPEATGVRRFERRYGFATRPLLIRFRSLDPEVGLLGLAAGADITLDACSFASLGAIFDKTGGLHKGPGRAITTVFIVENEINFLSFPPVESSIIVWGAGFGLERLEAATWLADMRVVYWGDIDTNGFAILDDLRSRFAHVESFLMDEATLDRHAEFWVAEPSAVDRNLPHLTGEENALYCHLRSGRPWLGLPEDPQPVAVRLEQERIRFGWLQQQLDAVGD